MFCNILHALNPELKMGRELSLIIFYWDIIAWTVQRKIKQASICPFLCLWFTFINSKIYKTLLTISGVLAPSVWDVESAVDLLALLLLSPRSPFPPSLSSITKSMGIFPLRHEMYRWQKLSHSSWTCNRCRLRGARNCLLVMTHVTWKIIHPQNFSFRSKTRLCMQITWS